MLCAARSLDPDSFVCRSFPKIHHASRTLAADGTAEVTQQTPLSQEPQDPQLPEERALPCKSLGHGAEAQ